MSAQSYITSGLLERQAVGLASAEEIREIEEMSVKYPAIQNELDEINRALKGYILAHQVPPPDGLRERLLQASREQPREMEKSGTSKKTTVTKTSKTGSDFNVSASTIATVLLALALAAACFTAFSFFKEAQRTKKEVVVAQKEAADLKKQTEASARQEQLLKNKLQSLRHPSTIPVPLRGTRLGGNALAIIYWNDVLKTHLIDVKRMPDVPEGKELRIWVNMDRQPRNIGELKPNPGEDMSGLPFIENPEAYYVTLEDKNADVEIPNYRQVMMYVEFQK